MKSTLLLLSGGLDSATCLGIALDEGYDVHAVSFDYGQRHAIELDAARSLAKHYQLARHTVIQVPAFRQAGGSALTSDIPVPQHDSVEELTEGIPPTYVPARNLVFLSLATAVAEAAGVNDLFIGVNAIDYSGYPDCRAEFIAAFEQAATLGTRSADEKDSPGFTIHTPLVELSKEQIIRRGIELGVPYELTHSCYSPIHGASCGRCDSCLLRLKGFEDAGKPDPIEYATSPATNA